MRCLIFLVLLTGCASTPTLDPNYVAYLESMERIERNRAEAIKAKYAAQAESAKAAADIARNGGETAKALAVVSLTRGESLGEYVPQQASVSLPAKQEGWDDKALRWAGVVGNFANPWIAGFFGYRLGTEQSRNSRDVAISQNNAFASVASNGFNANAQIAASGFNSTNSGFTAIREIAVNARPNITVTNGAVSTGAGNASYTQTTTTTTNSHNRQCQGGNGAPGGAGGQGTTTGGAGAAGGVGGAANC